MQVISRLNVATRNLGLSASASEATLHTEILSRFLSSRFHGSIKELFLTRKELIRVWTVTAADRYCGYWRGLSLCCWRLRNWHCKNGHEGITLCMHSANEILHQRHYWIVTSSAMISLAMCRSVIIKYILEDCLGKLSDLTENLLLPLWPWILLYLYQCFTFRSLMACMKKTQYIHYSWKVSKSQWTKCCIPFRNCFQCVWWDNLTPVSWKLSSSTTRSSSRLLPAVPTTLTGTLAMPAPFLIFFGTGTVPTSPSFIGIGSLWRNTAIFVSIHDS